MKVLKRDLLNKFVKKHANAKPALDAWFAEVSRSDCRWETSQDIKERYASASFLSGNRVIFNIKGNHYRLVVRVKYKNGIAVIDWVGTHSDYDKKTF